MFVLKKSNKALNFAVFKNNLKNISLLAKIKINFSTYLQIDLCYESCLSCLVTIIKKCKVNNVNI